MRKLKTGFWKTFASQDEREVDYVLDFPHNYWGILSRDIANHVVKSLEQHPEYWYTQRALWNDPSWDTARIRYQDGPRVDGIKNTVDYAHNIWVGDLEESPWSLTISHGSRVYGGVGLTSFIPFMWFAFPRWKIIRAVRKFDKQDATLVAMGMYREGD